MIGISLEITVSHTPIREQESAKRVHASIEELLRLHISYLNSPGFPIENCSRRNGIKCSRERKRDRFDVETRREEEEEQEGGKR